jgi:tetratricopeptide (TPR) repeat protein
VPLRSILVLAARIALAGAVFLSVAPAPAAAQVSAEEAVAYASWQAASTAGDVAKATEIAQQYLKQFPTGQYADYLKKWVAQGQMTALDAAAKEKRTADVLTIGNGILANDAENLSVIYTMALAVRGEMMARPPVYTNAAVGTETAKKGIALLESGKTLSGVDKNATLAWMTQMLALNAQKAGSADEAVKLFEKSTSYAPKDKAGRLLGGGEGVQRDPRDGPLGGGALRRSQGGPREGKHRGRRRHRRRRPIRGVREGERAARGHGRQDQPDARVGLQGPLPRGHGARRPAEDPAGQDGRRGRRLALAAPP